MTSYKVRCFFIADKAHRQYRIGSTTLSALEEVVESNCALVEALKAGTGILKIILIKAIFSQQKNS